MSLSGLQLDGTDDEFFGTLESRSNLASLFGNEAQIEDSNQSLKYKPPKQAQNTVESGKAWNVKVAKVVTAFKLINQEYVSQGRVGLAILSNSQSEYRVIIYRTKNNVLATKTLLAGVKLIFKSSYLQFHDDTNEFWSVFLETADEKSILDKLQADFISTVEDATEKPETTTKVEPAKKLELSMKLEQQKTPEPAILDPQPDHTAEDSDPTTKAKLLSRMAKMGQPLPKLATPRTATDVSDSSDTEVINIPPKPSILPRKVTKTLIPVVNPVPNTGLVTYSAPIQETQYMNMLLTENRTQNTEIRMNLSKLETKIEKVLDRIELLGNDADQRSNKKDKDDEIVSLEEKVLELRKENRTLRQNIRELETKGTTLQKREKKWRVDDDDEEFAEVLSRLGIQLKDCRDLDEEKLELLEKAIFKMSQVENHSKRTEESLTERNKEIAHLKEKVSSLQNDLKDFQDLKRKTESLAKEKEDLEEQLRLAKVDSKDTLQTTVKQIMNNLYADIAATIESAGETLPKETVLRICGNAMRKETINAFKGNTK